MPTQIDPSAFQNAFYANQDWLARGRQEQAQTAQNKLAQMYAANNDARAASAEQRAQAGFDASQQAGAAQIDAQAREQVAGWANNLLSRQDIDDNARVQIVQQAVQNPATADVLKRAGVAQMDWNNPEQVLRGLHGAAGWGQQVQQQGPKVGAYNPSDYTPDSWASFLKSGDPAGLHRYTTPRQEYAPSYQNVTRTLPDGSTQQGTFDQRTGAYNWSGAVVPAGTKEASAATGKARGEAAADLPRIEANADQTLQVLDQLANSNLDLIYGVASIVPTIPGTKQADALAVWDQVQGKAFLEAFGSLKGGGQITEKEGEKATAAITRLQNRKQSPQSAEKAIEELRQVVTAGVERARRKARMAGGQKQFGGETAAERAKRLGL